MDIQSTTFSQQVRTIAQSDDKKSNGVPGQEISDLAHLKNDLKKQQNAAILQSTISVSATDSPQALALKTALEGINDALEESLGGNAIQSAIDSGIDLSPEATAERIVSLSTAHFDSFQQRHTEYSQEEAVTEFTNLIQSGVDQGFTEAKDILSSLAVLEGNVLTDIDNTYDLVQDKLSAFVDSFKLDGFEVEI